MFGLKSSYDKKDGVLDLLVSDDFSQETLGMAGQVQQTRERAEYSTNAFLSTRKREVHTL
jgi:hypothetical protein